MSILKDNINGGTEALSKLMKRKYFIAPGVFDGISAILAEKAGFSALYLSGSGVAGRSGLPDLSLTTLSEVVDEAQRVVAVTKLPLIVDADTGFGEAINVVRCVKSLESAGAAAIHIEDQEAPKRCGQLDGKKLISEKDMERKIRAAVATRKNRKFMIIARTDARAVEGFEGAVRRANLYLEAGADVIFPEALESQEEFKRYAKEVKAPLIANMTEFGKSPLIEADVLGDMGYKIVLFPLTGFRAALLSMENAYSALKSDLTQKGFIDKLMTRKRFYEIIDYYGYQAEDDLFYSGKNKKK